MADGADPGSVAGPSRVGEILNGAGTWRLRNTAPYMLGLMMLFDTWDSTIIAYTLPSISAAWKLGPMAGGWLISSCYAGQLVGAILCGSWSETRGRLTLLRPLVIVMCLLAVACGLTQNYAQLIVIRLVQGVAIGGALPIAVGYLNEIAPTATRGRYVSTFQFFMLCGFYLASVSSAALVPVWGWRPMFILGALPLLLLPYLFRLPESPRWLAARGRPTEALHALERLGASVPEMGDRRIAEARAAAVPHLRVGTLLNAQYRKTTIMVCSIWFLTSFVSFGMLNWLPSIYVTIYHVPLATSLRYSAILPVVSFFLPLILRVTIDRIGRRPLPIVGTFVGAFILLAVPLLGTRNMALIVPVIVLGQIGMSFSSILAWPYAAEVYDTRVRSLGLGVASSMGRAASMLTPVAIGGVLGLTASVAPVFLILGGSALVLAFVWLFGTRETAGVEIDP